MTWIMTCLDYRTTSKISSYKNINCKPVHFYHKTQINPGENVIFAYKI